MIRKGVFLLFIVLGLQGVAYGQKVKYKDLLVLLNAKQYDQAEPFLKKYLAENDDNPSAYLFMGIIYQEKSAKDDVLKEANLLISHIDSAILFYDKSYPKITEKDVKRNDGNYVMYTRRDLRTGEFGIKLSDIQLDIETRVKALKEKKERIKSLNKNYKLAETQYHRANSLYKTLQSRFTTHKELYLRANDSLIINLDQLVSVFDSSQVTFKNYKTTSQVLGKTGYNQLVDLQEIKDLKKDGSTLSDFMMDDIKLWNYSDWSKKSINTIREDVYPMRKDLLAFDSHINKIRDQLKKDPVPVSTAELKSDKVFEELKKWDSDPMPASLFRVKIADLEYSSDVAAESKLNDMDNISKKIALIKEQQILLHSLDSFANALVNRDWDKDATNYRDFITSAYGTTAVLINLGKSTKEFARREIVRKKKELEDNIRLLKWVFSDSDSIPLFKDVPDGSKYKPLVIAETHTVGIKQENANLTGYFYTVTPSRTADLKVNFPVDTVSITQRDLPLIKGLSLASTDQLYFVLFYSETLIDGKFPISLARISRLAGLEWSSFIKTDFTPMELKYTTTSGEISIKTTGTDGNSKMVVIDKAGKRLQ